MPRAPTVALLLLLLAGGAFAALGVRGWRLEEAAARRRAEDRAARALRLAAERAPLLALQGVGPPEESWTLEAPPRRAAIDGDDALLLRQAAWEERVADDPESAFATLERLTARPGDVAVVAALRAGILRARGGRASDATPLLERAATAPPDLADDQDVPIRLAARYHLARTPPRDADRLGAFLEEAGNGRRLRGAPGVGPEDLLLVLSRHAGDPAALPAPLAAAADRARLGRRLLAALPADGVAVAEGLVARRIGGALEVRPPASLLGEVRGDDEILLRVAAADGSEDRGPLALRLDAPLGGLSLVAEILPPPGPRVPWNLVAGLVVYALGSVLAVLSLRRAIRTARDQGDFVAAVSHEMKTPIASVRAMAEMLADGAAEQPSVARRYAERIAHEMERLGASVRNVLDAARIERMGDDALVTRPVDPAAIVREAAEGIRPAWERRGFRLEVTADPSPGPLAADAEALRGVLANLLDNAAKYGGDRKEIQVTGGPTSEGGYRIAVLDRGIGIPASERERVFDRFFRGAAARAAALPGVGLGLHVARRVVEGHGGTIHAEPREGGGTALIVTLPRGRES